MIPYMPLSAELLGPTTSQFSTQTHHPQFSKQIDAAGDGYRGKQDCHLGDASTTRDNSFSHLLILIIF